MKSMKENTPRRMLFSCMGTKFSTAVIAPRKTGTRIPLLAFMLTVASGNNRYNAKTIASSIPGDEIYPVRKRIAVSIRMSILLSPGFRAGGKLSNTRTCNNRKRLFRSMRETVPEMRPSTRERITMTPRTAWKRFILRMRSASYSSVFSVIP